MQKKTVTIINKLGLHARAAGKLVDTAQRFSSRTELGYKDKTINAKSIMAVMMLGAAKHAELEITTDGDDEESALEAIEALIANRFGEKQ